MKKILTIAFILSAFFAKSQGNTPCTATSLTVSSGICGTYTAGTTVGATYQNDAANGGTPTCASPGAPDVWFSFVAPASGAVIITSNSGTITDGGMQIYSSSTNLCTGTLTALNCDDDSGPGLMPELNLCGFTPGNTYWIRFWRWGGSGTGTFSICVYQSSYPVNAQNCAGSTFICTDASFAGNSGGFSTQELNVCNQGCLSVEHQSSWYTFTMLTSGTVSLSINTTFDYDFAIWGPNIGCPPAGAPIRCSYSGLTGNTGLGMGATDFTEGAGGDKWVAPLNVLAGQTYILLIDNFTANSTPFTLDWTLTGGASFSCSPLPIELFSFVGENKGDYNLLKWSTASEINNDYFIVEKSEDAIDWQKIGTLNGAGNSSIKLDYEMRDHNVSSTLTYYRLTQVDFDGNKEVFDPIAVTSKEVKKTVVKVTNLMGQEVSEDYEWIRIIYYSDGTTMKKVGK